MKRLLTGLLIIGVIGLMGYLLVQDPASTGGSTENSEAPDFEMKLEPGDKSIKLSSLRGHVVVLDFWATWCGPCKMSMPELEKLQEKYKGQGLQVIGISEDMADSVDKIPTVKQKLGVTYPTALGKDIEDLDKLYPHTGIPALYVIDKAGKIRHKQEGVPSDGSLGKLEDKVAELLKQS